MVVTSLERRGFEESVGCIERLGLAWCLPRLIIPSWDQGVDLKVKDACARWVVVKIMVPFWVPHVIRQLLFRVPTKGP